MSRSKKTWLIAISFLIFSVLVLFKSMSVEPRKEAPRMNGGEAMGKASAKVEKKLDTKMLHIAVSMNSKQFAALRALSQKYESFHRDSFVLLENVPLADAYADWKKKSQIGDAPDVMLLQNNWVNEFAALGYLQFADAYFSSDLQSLQLPQVMKQVKWNGYLWAVPKDVDPYLLVYNKAKAAEWSLPMTPQNSKDLAQLNQMLWKASGGKNKIYWDIRDVYAFFSLIGSLGGFEENEALLARTIEELLYSSKGTEKAGSDKIRFRRNEDVWQQLKQGNEPVIVCSLSAYLKNANETLGFVRLPSANLVGIDKGLNLGTWLKGTSFVVSSRSKLQAEAFDWIREMTAVESQKTLWKEGYVMPALISVYQVPQIRREQLFTQIIPIVERSRTFAPEPEMPQKITSLQTVLEKLIKNEATSKSVAEEIGKNWKASFTAH